MFQEHRLIRPSGRMLKHQGGHYLAFLLQTRCQEVLSKVELQFCDRSANNSYPRSKQMLSSFIERQKSFDSQCDGEWEVLSI